MVSRFAEGREIVLDVELLVLDSILSIHSQAESSCVRPYHGCCLSVDQQHAHKIQGGGDKATSTSPCCRWLSVAQVLGMVGCAGTGPTHQHPVPNFLVLHGLRCTPASAAAVPLQHRQPGRREMLARHVHNRRLHATPGTFSPELMVLEDGARIDAALISAYAAQQHTDLSLFSRRVGHETQQSSA